MFQEYIKILQDVLQSEDHAIKIGNTFFDKFHDTAEDDCSEDIVDILMKLADDIDYWQ